MPKTRLWSTLLCCLLSLQEFAVEAQGQQKDDVPLAGNGSAYASKCNAAKQDWVKAAGRSLVSVATINSTYEVVAKSTVYTTLTYLSDNATSPTPYTLCDGYPRINGSRTITSTLVPYTATSTRLTTTSIFATRPAPNCTINSSDCARLEQAYESAGSVYTGYMSAHPAAYTAPPVPTTPICGPATLTSASSAVGGAVCAMNEASVQLLYWPVTVAASCDSCHRSNCPTTTPAPSISGKANIAVWHNITVTSPTVYIAFEGSWSFTSDGKAYTEPAQLVIPQKPDAVSTYCGEPGGGYGPPQKINYANFNSPVPADVYRCQPSCYRDPLPYPAIAYTVIETYTFGSTTTVKTAAATTYQSIAPTNICSTIWDDYAPVLSIPEAFKTIRPAGYVDFMGKENLCQFSFDEDAVLFDPPIALTQAQVVVKPTLPAYNSAQLTAVGTHIAAIPAETGQQDKPALPDNAASPQEFTLSPAQPTPQPGAGRVEQTATALNVGGYIAAGIGLTIPDDGGDQNNAGQNNAGQNNAGQNNDADNNQDVTIAAVPGGHGLVINGATITLDAQTPGKTGSESGSGGSGGSSGSGGSGGSNSGSASAQVGVITIGGQPRTFMKQGSQVTIDGQTITPGDSAIIAGQTVNISSDGTHIEIGTGSGKTAVELKTTGTTSISSGQVGYITAAGRILTYAIINGSTVIDGKTLNPDHAVTLTSARPAASTTKKSSSSSSHTASTGAGPESTTASDAAASMMGIFDWRCQLLLLLGLMAVLIGL